MRFIDPSLPSWGLNEKAFPHRHHRDLYDGGVWANAGRYTHAGLTTRPVESGLRRWPIRFEYG